MPVALLAGRAKGYAWGGVLHVAEPSAPQADGPDDLPRRSVPRPGHGAARKRLS